VNVELIDEDLFTLFDTFSRKVIAFNPIYAKITESTDCALFLSQLLYWSRKSETGWVIKTQTEIEDMTCLSRRQQEGATKKLQALDIIEVRKMGIPQRNVYKIKKENLIKRMVEYETEDRKRSIESRVHKNAISLESDNYESYPQSERHKRDIARLNVLNIERKLLNEKNAPKRHFECTKTPLQHVHSVHSKSVKRFKNSLSISLSKAPPVDKSEIEKRAREKRRRESALRAAHPSHIEEDPAPKRTGPVSRPPEGLLETHKKMLSCPRGYE